MTRRTQGRGALPRLTAAVCLVPAMCLAPAVWLASTASANVDLEALYAQSAQESGRPLAAEEILDRAFERLFPDLSYASIVAVRTQADGKTERSRFRVLRRRLEDSRRIVIQSLEPASVAGTRVLQIEPDSGDDAAWAFVRSVNRQPAPTPFRLANTFLCTWYRDGGVAPETSTIERRDYIILSRVIAEFEGETVHRVMTRPVRPRGYERVEFTVAASDFAILRYAHYLSRGDAEPALIGRAPRNGMVEVDGRALPGRIEFEDRTTRSRIDVQIRHGQLPADLPGSLFDPRSFHRIGIAELVGEGS